MKGGLEVGGLGGWVVRIVFFFWVKDKNLRF